MLTLVYFLGLVFVWAVVTNLLLSDEQNARLNRYMIQNLRYASYIIRHKYFVFVAGLTLRAPLWRLLIHDWSKFLPDEWGAYRRYFYTVSCDETKRGFHRAWLKHIHRNSHHWEHWCKFHYDNGGANITLTGYRMPETLVREMVSDWLGANRAINGKYQLMKWYYGNPAVAKDHPDSAGHRYKMKLHADTRVLVENLLTMYALPLEGKK